MHARVFMAQARPGMIDEGVGIFHDSITPAAQRQAGYPGALLLVDRRTGKFITVSLWASEDAMLGSEHTGFFREQVARIAHIIMGTPLREHYEVNAAVGMQREPPPHSQARVTTGQNLPGTLPDLIQIVEN